MARTHLSLLGIACMVMVGCAAAEPRAADTDDHRVALKALVKPLRVRLTRADTNRNGQLESRELTRSSAKLARERFNALDKNGDGKLDGEELPAVLRTHVAPGGGAVTLDEFIAARNRHLIHRLRAADRNGDGALSRHEVGALRWVRLRTADRNHDGVVTFEELHRAFGKHQ